MKTTIDTAGRVVIPKPIRDQAGIAGGTALEIRFRDGRVEIEPPASDIKVKMVNGVPVLTAAKGAGKLSARETEAVLQKIRREREIRGFGGAKD